jgi:hypothetical protein
MTPSITFWTANAIIPIATFLINVVVRLFKQLPISAGADWALILVAFDWVASTHSSDFTPYIANQTLRNSLPDIMTGMLVAGLLFWIYCVYKLEPALDKMRSGGKSLGWSEIMKIVVAISLVCLDTWVHFSLFSFKQII